VAGHLELLEAHFGEGMEGKSPGEKLKSSGAPISERVLLSPVILLEGAPRKIKSLTTYLKPLKTVDYLHTKHQNQKVHKLDKQGYLEG